MEDKQTSSNEVQYCTSSKGNPREERCTDRKVVGSVNEERARVTKGGSVLSRLIMNTILVFALFSSSVQASSHQVAHDTENAETRHLSNHYNKYNGLEKSKKDGPKHKEGLKLPEVGVKLEASVDVKKPAAVSSDIKVSVVSNPSSQNVLGNNFDDVKPVLLLNTFLKVLKAQGQGSTVWVAVEWKQMRFLIVTGEGAKPARIILPKGTIVDLISPGARNYEELRTVVFTVTFDNGEYLNLGEEIWNKIVDLPMSTIKSSPAIEYHSGNIICPNQVAFGALFARQIIEVLPDSGLQDLFGQLEVSGVEVRGPLYSSNKGYKTIEMDNGAGGKDTYRVCVYCLVHEVIRAQSDSKITFDIAKKQLGTQKSIIDQFNLLNHQLPGNVFIQTRYPDEISIYIPVVEGTFIEYDSEDLLNLVELNQQNKLRNKWLTRIELKDVDSSKTNNPIIVFNNEVYELDSEIAGEYAKKVASDFEPEFFKFKANEVDPFQTNSMNLIMDQKKIEEWFDDGNKVVGLFSSNYINENSRTWPFVLRNEDGVVRKYILNLIALKSALDLAQGKEAIKLSSELKGFIISRRSEFSFDIRERIGDSVSVLSWIQFRFHDKPLLLSGPCLQDFLNLNIQDAFTIVNKSTKEKLRPNSKYVKINDKLYIFDFDVMKNAVEEDTITDPIGRSIVRRCFQLSSEENDPTVVRSFPGGLSGKCQGKFINDSLCEGTFIGSVNSCPQSPSEEGCLREFTCVGGFSKGGCRGNFKGSFLVNDTKFETLADGYVNPLSGVAVANGTLKNEELGCEVAFTQGFNMRRKEITKGSVKRSSEEVNPLEAKVKFSFYATCEGDFNIEKIECIDERFSSDRCFSDLEEQEDGTCTGFFKGIRCENGGTIDKCTVEGSNDKIIDCSNGVWDGTDCIKDPEYIFTGGNNYFKSSRCTGKSIKGSSCEGDFLNAENVNCEAAVDSVDKICPDNPVSKSQFNCSKGILNSTGCYGVYQGRVKINESQEYTVGSEKGAMSSNLDIFQSKVTLELIEEQEAQETDNWVKAKIVCGKGYNGDSKICSSAEFQGTHQTQDQFSLTTITCLGDLNLTSLECINSTLIVKHCDALSSTLILPLCIGNYTEITCKEGGSAYECAGKDVLGTRLVCEEAEWDGKRCKGKQITLLVNDSAFIVGTCDGLYTENESCDGILKGDVIECPTYYLTEGIACGVKESQNFKCEGKSDLGGCSGRFTGRIEAHGDVLTVDNVNNGHTTFGKFFTASPVVIGFWKLVEAAKGEVLVGRDTDVSGVCSKFLDAETKDCGAAEVNFTINADKNVTFARFKCEGIFNLDSLTCDKGLTAVSCNGSRIYTETDVCNGVYYYTKCENGGNISECHKKTENDKVVTCDGYFNQGKCNPFVIPQLPIIQINHSYYIKGHCSGIIKANVCKGTFEGKLAYTCKGDPLYVQEDFDLCSPYIKVPEFGNCSGEMSNDGCSGVFTRQISENGKLWNVETDENALTGPEGIKGRAVFTRVVEETDVGHKIVFVCSSDFFFDSLKCNNSNFVDSKEDSSNLDKSGYFSLTFSSCSSGLMPLGEHKCETNDRESVYRYIDCYGKNREIVIVEDGTFTHSCLGDLKEFAECSRGGDRGVCRNEEHVDRSCINSYFNGTLCVTDMAAENTDLRITNLGTVENIDYDGQSYKMVTFEIDEFTMFGAFANSTIVSENVLDQLTFDFADRNGKDGSISNIRQKKDTTPVNIDEGIMQKITFSDFKLDELPLRSFAVDDEAKIIKLSLKKMTIKQCVFTNFEIKNDVVRNLKFGEESYKDYGIDELKINVAYGEILMRDTVMYLPYFKNSTIDELIANPEKIATVNIGLPKTEGIYIPPKYGLTLRTESDLIFLEFPEWEIDSRSLDIVRMEDIIVGSDSFTSNADNAQQIIKDYEQKLISLGEAQPEETN